LKLPEIPELRMTPEDSSGDGTSFGPLLYVREDGTVDWEGALQDRAALRKFGGAVWARINGQTPDDLEKDEDEESKDADGPKKRNVASGISHGTKEKAAVIAKIEETVAIQEARKELTKLEAQLREMEKAHTALIASGKSTSLEAKWVVLLCSSIHQPSQQTNLLSVLQESRRDSLSRM
jgi:hypothetical protein